MSLLSTYARSYRLARAIGAALFLLIGILWLSWARSHPPTSHDRVTATVTRIVDNPLGPDADCVALIRLDDGREGRVLMPRYAAAAGGRVPLVIEAYADGETYLTFDVDRWVDSASGR